VTVDHSWSVLAHACRLARDRGDVLLCHAEALAEQLDREPDDAGAAAQLALVVDEQRHALEALAALVQRRELAGIAANVERIGRAHGLTV